MTIEDLTRYRLHFHKTKELRYIGHLDLHRSIERMLRRAELPVDYSKGFNPRMKLNLSTALPLGCSSTTELADFWLLTDLGEEEVFLRLLNATPPALDLKEVEKIDLKSPALQTMITGATYRVEILESINRTKLGEKIDEFLRAESLERTRRGKVYDLRPLVRTLEIAQETGTHQYLKMLLQVGEGHTGRPEEVLLQLELNPANCLIERTHLHFSSEEQGISET
jgi:radical SAM-linked protein